MTGELHQADRSADSLLNPLTQQRIAARLEALRDRLNASWLHHIGFPGTADMHHSVLAPLLTQYALNNIGDPALPCLVPNETRAFEVQVLDLAAELLRAPTDGWWGYVTTGATEGTLKGLLLGRSLFPDGVVVHSSAAHYSVRKAAHLLDMPTATVDVTDRGEMDYADLTVKLAQYAHRRPIIVASIGTPMTEAVDDIRRIITACERLGIGPDDRYIHADAALSGVPLAVAPLLDRPGFDLADGADSIIVSGHKFLSTLMPCGIFLAKQHRLRGAEYVDYLDSYDTTISGSRSGHLPLLLWHTLARHGREGLQLRAERARAKAAYAHARLAEIGWPAWRHDHAFTVVLRSPPPDLAARWAMPTVDGWSHLICMPGVTTYQLDAFIDELAESVATADSQLAASTTS